MLVFLTVVGVRLGYSYASVSKEHDPIPWEEDIEILYEGNSKEAGNVKTESYDFYRITVKFPNASGKIREVPKSLVIYETDLGTGIKRVVHTADFGMDAGKTLVSINQPFLGKSDSFHYRAFTVEKNPLGSYRYDAMLTWSEKGGRPEAKRNAGKLVTVTEAKV